MVDLGGSLAVASRGLYATGVSTDLNGILHRPCLRQYNRVTPCLSHISQLRRESRRCLESGCNVRQVYVILQMCTGGNCGIWLISLTSWKDYGLYFNTVHEQQRRVSCKRKSYKVSASIVRTCRVQGTPVLVLTYKIFDIC